MTSDGQQRDRDLPSTSSAISRCLSDAQRPLTLGVLNRQKSALKQWQIDALMRAERSGAVCVRAFRGLTEGQPPAIGAGALRLLRWTEAFERTTFRTSSA